MRLSSGIRQFNKHVTNHVLGRIARSAHGPFGIIRHVGRRSGKTYETPVIVVPVADGFVVALTYGREVDWYRNVMSAGRCTVIWHQREYAIERIEPMDWSAARPLFPQPERFLLPILGTKHFVHMTDAADHA